MTALVFLDAPLPRTGKYNTRRLSEPKTTAQPYNLVTNLVPTELHYFILELPLIV